MLSPNLQLLLGLLGGFTFGSICFIWAKKRGKNPIFWFSIGLLFGFIGLFSLYLKITLDEMRKVREANETASNQATGQINTPALSKKDSLQTHFNPIHDEWYAWSPSENQSGPFTFDILKTKIETGQIGSETHLWCPGMMRWEKLDNLAYLKVMMNK